MEAFAREMEKSRRRQAVVGEALAEDLEETDRAMRKCEEAMEVLRAKLQLAEEVLIPGLVDNNTKFREMCKADTAIQVMKRVSASVTDRE